MKKQISALMLALVMAAGSLTSCNSAGSSSAATSGSTASGAASASSSAAEPAAGTLEGTLEVWIYEEFYKDTDQSPIAKVTAQFVEQNPNVKINITPVPYGSSNYRDKFIQAANGGGGPDVILSDNVWVPQFAAMDIIIPLTDYMSTKKDDYFQGTIDAATYNNNLYGMPFIADCMVMFYNKDMFVKAGLDPEKPPKTWEEFREYAIALRDNGMGGYGLLGGWGGSFEWLPWFWQNGGEIVGADGKASFNSAEGMEATEYFLNLLTKDKVVPEAALTWKSWDELATGFANQTVGMCQGMAVLQQALARQSVDFQWGVALLPARKEEANTLGGSHWVINKNSQKTDVAYAWLDFISTKEQSLPMCDTYLRTSARKDATEQKLAQESEVTRVFIEALKTSRPRPIIPEWTAIDYDALQPAFMKVIFEGADLNTAMQEAEKIANEALAG